MEMDIAMLSVGMHQQEVSQKMEIGALKMAMEAETSFMNDMTELMDSIDVSAMTGIGANIDILA